MTERTAFLKCIYLFLAAQGLPCCVWAFSSCSAQASQCSGFSHCVARVLERRLSSYGTQA